VDRRGDAQAGAEALVDRFQARRRVDRIAEGAVIEDVLPPKLPTMTSPA
jgi:hypothetical protein